METRSNVDFFSISLQPTPTSKFLQGYAGAVSSAVSLAVSELLQHFFLTNNYNDIITACIFDSGNLKETFFSVLVFDRWG